MRQSRPDRGTAASARSPSNGGRVQAVHLRSSGARCPNPSGICSECTACGAVVEHCDRCGADCYDIRQKNGRRSCILCVTADLEAARTEATRLRGELQRLERAQRSDHITLDGITAVCVRHGYPAEAGDDDEATWLEAQLSAMRGVAARPEG